MNRLRWTAVVLGIWFVSISSILPRVDSPETAYDETDAPINLTTPVEAWTIVVMPIMHFTVISEEQRVWSERSTTSMLTSKPGTCASRSVQGLLSILLC